MSSYGFYHQLLTLLIVQASKRASVSSGTMGPRVLVVPRTTRITSSSSSILPHMLVELLLPHMLVEFNSTNICGRSQCESSSFYFSSRPGFSARRTSNEQWFRPAPGVGCLLRFRRMGCWSGSGGFVYQGGIMCGGHLLLQIWKQCSACSEENCSQVPANG